MSRESSWSPTVYDELRRLAGTVMLGEREGHTLEPTGLAHEAWLRLRHSRNAGELEHGAFLGLAAQAMRRILVEHARRRGAQKRGGALRRTTLAERAAPEGAHELALDLDAAVDELAAYDAELARLVELRFYAGASYEEIAAAAGISTRTVKRRWRFARAWLQERLQDEPQGDAR